MVPLALAIAAAVWITSSGPVLFLQKRIGRNGRVFTMFKFRTLTHATGRAHHSITTLDNQRFTPVGPFLRQWKLDELPQLVNVLLGHMSLIGPRPKLPEHVNLDPPCRPGVTGMATNVFACEEAFLARVPKDRLDAYYHAVVIPAKRQLDIEYMSHATFPSDLQLLIDCILRRWDDTAVEYFLSLAAIECDDKMIPSKVPDRPWIMAHLPILPSANQPVEAEQTSVS